MSELKICRVCLRTEAKLYQYDQYQLKSYYEEILALTINEPDDLPRYFCFECSTMLHKFHKFKEKCFFGQKILKEMLWKGPDGIIELLKLSQELKSNNEMSSTQSTRTTSQHSELFENPFIDTDTEKSHPLSKEISGSDTLEIDSFFIKNHDVDLSVEEKAKGNQVSNICHETTDNITDSIQLLSKSDSGYVAKSDFIKDSVAKLTAEKSPENESTTIFCGLRNEAQTFLQSGLDFIKLGLDPTENENSVKAVENLATCSQEASVPQEISKSMCTGTNLESTDINVDINTKDVEDSATSTIIYCQALNSSPEVQGTGSIYAESNINLSSNNNVLISSQNNTERENPTILYCDASTVQNLNLSGNGNQSLPIIYYEVSGELPALNEPLIGYVVTELDSTSNNDDDAIIHNVDLRDKKIIKIGDCKLLSTSSTPSDCNINHTNLNKNITNHHNESTQQKTQNELTSMQCELSISPEVLKTNVEYSKKGSLLKVSRFDDDTESTGSQAKQIFTCNVINTPNALIQCGLKKSNLFLPKNNDVDRVKITSKNQLAPNIHCVQPTTSQEYFECDHEPEVENIYSQDTLHRLHFKSGTEIEAVKKKRIRDRRKYPFNKRVKPNPCHKKCQNRCSTRMTEVERSIIHERYWKMDKRKQQEWLVSCIKPKNIRRRQGVSIIKNISYDYILNQGGKNVRVCQQFLMKTLDISQMRIRYAITKLGTLKNNKNDDLSDDSDSSTSTYSDDLRSISSD